MDKDKLYELESYLSYAWEETIEIGGPDQDEYYAFEQELEALLSKYGYHTTIKG